MRIRLSLTLLALVVALVLSAGAGAAQAAGVSGHITDAVSGAPLPYATIQAWHADGEYYTSWSADAQGAYDIQLYGGAWKVRFSAAFHVTEFWNDKPDQASADQLVTTETPLNGMDVALARAPQAHIQGQVLDDGTGDPLAGVMVQACIVDGDDWTGGPSVYTAADGTYDLTVEPGTWGIVYDRYGYERVFHRHASSAAGASTFTVGDGDTLTRVDETMPRTPILVDATAIDVDGEHHAGVALQLLDPVTGVVIRSALTDVDGTCTIDVSDLIGQPFKERLHDPSGELADAYYNYNVHPAESLADAATVTPTIGSRFSVFLWMYSPLRGEIKGRTLDEDGNPVAGVKVMVRPESMYGAGAPSVISGADGSYAIPGLYTAGHTRYSVEFEPGLDSPDYAFQAFDERATGRHPDGVAVAPGQTVTIDSALWRKGAIAGDVTGVGNRCLDGIKVSLSKGDGTWLAETTTREGAYHFGPLEQGTYRLEFSDAASLYEPETQDLTLGPMEKVWYADASLDPRYYVWGHVGAEYLPGQPAAGATITLYDAAGRVADRQTASSDGYFLFEPLPAGTYYVGAEPTLAFLGAFFDQTSSLESATPVTLDAATPYAAPYLIVPVRCASALASVVRDDGSLDNARPLFARATALAGDASTAVAGEGWSGSARIFTHGSGGWALQQTLAPGKVPADDYAYGRSVAVAGDTVAVGAFYDDGVGAAPGKVYIYTRSGDSWSLQQLLAPKGAAYRSFGKDVALSGDTMLVGAPYVTIGDGRWAGCVYVYTRSGSTWVERTRLTCRGAGEDDYFGSAVALQSGTAVISAPMRDTEARINGGEAFVFTGAGAGWEQRAVLRPTDGENTPRFGDDVALDGGTIAVGASQAAGTGAIFAYTGAGGAWILQARLSASDDQVGSELGAELALRGDEVLAWAYAPHAGGHARGAAYVFRRTGSDWKQDAQLRVTAGDDETWALGRAVTIAAGDELVSAPEQPIKGTADYGFLYAFHPYITGLGETLTVPASGGVLANDRAASGKPLAAALVRAPYRGSLTLHADGSFDYTPEQGWAGDDSFTYAATDGIWTSLPATACITTRDPNAPNVAAEDVPTGWVNTPVTVTLSARDDTEVTAIDYRPHALDPRTWVRYAKPFTVSGQGASPFELRARDVFGNARRGAFTIKLDTRRPVPKILAPCAVRRGGTMALRYLVADPRPGSPTAKVTIRVLKNGRAVLTMLTDCRPGKALTFRQRCTLRRGRYVLTVTATDAAGNTSAKPAKSTLTVR